MNDPQGEIDSRTQIYKGIEGVTGRRPCPKTPGVECTMGTDKGTEDEVGRLVFKPAGAQEIFCRNTSLEPVAEIEAQYMIAKTKLDYTMIEVGPIHDQLVAAKKELTDGKFNGMLAQFLASFNLMTETKLVVKANSAKPTELKFTRKPGRLSLVDRRRGASREESGRTPSDSQLRPRVSTRSVPEVLQQARSEEGSPHSRMRIPMPWSARISPPEALPESCPSVDLD